MIVRADSRTRTCGLALTMRVLHQLSYDGVGVLDHSLDGLVVGRCPPSASPRADTRSRTSDLLLTRELLCQLSYDGMTDRQGMRLGPPSKRAFVALTCHGWSRTIDNRVLQDLSFEQCAGFDPAASTLARWRSTK